MTAASAGGAVAPPLVTAGGGQPIGYAALASAIAAGIVGALMILVTPGFLALVAAQAGLGDQQLGYIAAWDINAMAVAIGISTFLLPLWDWRISVGVGLLLLVAGNFATAASHSYAAIAAARVLAGTGEGIAVGFAFAAFGRAANPDRTFAVYLVLGAVLGAGILLMLPALQAQFGPQRLFVANGVLAALVLLGLRWFPHGRRLEQDAVLGHGGLNRRMATWSLIAVFFYFFAIGAVWSYSERIGQASGLDAQQIAHGLSLGTFAGMGGAALAGLLPRRFGRAWPLAVSGAATILSYLLLVGGVSATAFTISMVLLLMSWNFAQPLLSGICCDADCEGRVVCAMGSIQTFGMGFGPAAVGLTLRHGGYAPTLWASCVILAGSLFLAILAIRSPRPDRSMS
ncbi:MFS transporter [Sphingomonas sp. CL5.1]|uniref:MFS transporter n=1 Tax=Sphingomonas sp. CL5.1 TaxID=2653203 RepID=UPI001583B3D8|nr:MFS transporter [Sphingomonas sp. CL5.1]QKR99590.1 MFS transporter [Sphingomonas sp. CL5.1]